MRWIAVRSSQSDLTVLVNDQIVRSGNNELGLVHVRTQEPTAGDSVDELKFSATLIIKEPRFRRRARSEFEVLKRVYQHYEPGGYRVSFAFVLNQANQDSLLFTLITQRTHGHSLEDLFAEKLREIEAKERELTLGDLERMLAETG